MSILSEKMVNVWLFLFGMEVALYVWHQDCYSKPGK